MPMLELKLPAYKSATQIVRNKVSSQKKNFKTKDFETYFVCIKKYLQAYLTSFILVALKVSSCLNKYVFYDMITKSVKFSRMVYFRTFIHDPLHANEMLSWCNKRSFNGMNSMKSRHTGDMLIIWFLFFSKKGVLQSQFFLGRTTQ